MATKICNNCQQTKLLLDFSQRKISNDGYRSVCRKCMNEAKKLRYKKDPNKRKQWDLNYVNANKIKVAKRMSNYHFNNQEKRRLANNHWYEKNKILHNIKCGIWIKEHKSIVNARVAKRHAAKLQRIPKWLSISDFIEIDWAYTIAAQKTQDTNQKWEVDHIIPIQGKYVSGLHVPSNLQIITKRDNCRKGNKWHLVV